MVVGVCTDDISSIFGFQSEFVARIKQKSLSVVGSYCLIY